MNLNDLHIRRRCRRQRASSYDRTGGNRDSVEIPAGQEHAVSTLAGPGIIRHIWLTVGGGGVDVYRSLTLSMRFDGAETPQVDVPLADFFCFGHGLLVDVNAAPIQVSRQPHIAEKPYRGGMNCTFPMPFCREAAISFRNRGGAGVQLYYYVDWEGCASLPEPVLLFHATLNEERTRPPEGQPRQRHNHFDRDLLNPGWDENYVLLNVEGFEGHYVGASLSITCRPGGAGKWWEGDDMFRIDGEPWPPRLHGTGTEDYFCLAWGFRQAACRPEYGVTYLEKGYADTSQIDGRFTAYRFHIHDPIQFDRSLHASLEHGHANDCEAEYRSVAYWYGKQIE